MSGVQLYSHQQKALEELATGKILHGGVGSGKSFTALFYYIQKESPKRLIIITTAGKRDKLEWDRDAAKLVIGKTASATAHGLLTVDSWNNISKYVDVEDAFFIFDEQRLVGSGAWVRAFLKIAKSNNWILLSATPGDTWMDYAPVFVANGLYKNLSQFKKEHVVYKQFVKYPQISHYYATDVLEKYRNMLLVEMPYETHTTRHPEEVYLDYDEELFRKVYKERWHIYEDRPLQDVGEMFRVMRKLVSTDESRKAKLRELMEKHPKMIIFYNFNYELELLRELCEGSATIGEWNGHKKTPVPDTDRWVYLVQYTSGAEGWNCTSTDTTVFWSLPYSWKALEQSHGRIDRLDTPFEDLWYYLFTTTSIVDVRLRQNLSDKEIFNERKFAKEVLGIDDSNFELDELERRYLDEIQE